MSEVVNKWFASPYDHWPCRRYKSLSLSDCLPPLPGFYRNSRMATQILAIILMGCNFNGFLDGSMTLPLKPTSEQQSKEDSNPSPESLRNPLKILINPYKC